PPLQPAESPADANLLPVLGLAASVGMAPKFDDACNAWLLPPMSPITDGGGGGSEGRRMPPLTSIPQGGASGGGQTTLPIPRSGTGGPRKATSCTGAAGGGTIMLPVDGEPVGEADGCWRLAAEPVSLPRGGRCVKR
ncbi:unnamed protein product, partial [Ectocarpus fasciculatus]